MADCTLFLVKIFRKPSKVQKSCQGSSYITLKVLSNKTKLILLPYPFNSEDSFRVHEIGHKMNKDETLVPK